MLVADLAQHWVLPRHAQDQEDAEEVLGPSEKVRHEALLILRRRHGQRPEAGGLNGERAAAGVLFSHELGEVQGFVDEGSEHHEAGVVESCAELCCYHVKIVSVSDGD